MLEQVGATLITAAIGALAWLAYFRPAHYRRIYAPIERLHQIACFVLAGWQAALLTIYDAVSKASKGSAAVEAAMSANFIDGKAFIIFLGGGIGLYILKHIPNSLDGDH